MSLFDAIKYPIDTRFREEDLEHIPLTILHAWVKEDLNIDNLYWTVKMLPWWADCLFYGGNKEFRIQALKKLRDRIVEYEPI